MTTTEDKIRIPMSERRPLTIAKGDWPRIAYGEVYSGQYDFQAFDGAKIIVRQHADGRAIVYGEAGDWKGGGRPARENREAGFLLAKGDDVVRAIRRVAGILAETEMVGEMAHAAARRCIADLPAEEDATPASDEVRMPREGARRLLSLLDRVNGCLRDDPSAWTVDGSDREAMRQLTDELRVVLAK